MQRFKELDKWDLISKVRSVLRPRGPYLVRDPKITIPDNIVDLDFEQPWIHIMRLKDRNCKLYTDVLVNCLNVLPEACLSCWKVVFRPQYLKDMDNLIPVMEKLATDKGYACKLGAERRPWTTG